MPMQKKNKIYCGLVGAALVAWAIDAMFFGNPESPNRDVASAATAPKAAPPAVASSIPSPEAPHENTGQWLGAKLREWSAKNPEATDQVRDIFSPPVSWIPQHPATPQPPPGKIAEDFQRDHHLTAVVLGASGGSAVIDGRLLRIGQSVGGCRLVAVSSGQADLVGPDGREFRVLIGPENDKNVK